MAKEPCLREEQVLRIASNLPVDIDHEVDLMTLQSLGDLMFWIESARHLLSVISGSAEVYPDLRRALERYGIRYNAGSWDRKESDGLQALMILQHSMLRKLQPSRTH